MNSLGGATLGSLIELIFPGGMIRGRLGGEFQASRWRLTVGCCPVVFGFNECSKKKSRCKNTAVVSATSRISQLRPVKVGSILWLLAVLEEILLGRIMR